MIELGRRFQNCAAIASAYQALGLAPTTSGSATGGPAVIELRVLSSGRFVVEDISGSATPRPSERWPMPFAHASRLWACSATAALVRARPAAELMHLFGAWDHEHNEPEPFLAGVLHGDAAIRRQPEQSWNRSEPRRDQRRSEWLRDDLHRTRGEANSLRLDLAEATALIDALESEVWRITTRWCGPDDGRSAVGAMDLLIQARTLMRRALLSSIHSAPSHRAAAVRDLRIAEVSFSFLLGLRSLRALKPEP